jgi:hypothetical protein
MGMRRLRGRFRLSVSSVEGEELLGGDSGAAPLPVPAPIIALPPRSEDVEMEMEMDLTPSSNTSSILSHNRLNAVHPPDSFDGWGPGMHHSDIELRTRIVNSVI